MLIVPDLVEELDVPGGDKTLNFIKRVMKIFTHAVVEVAGTSITGQVETGDGEAVAVETSVLVRTVPATATIAVTGGTAQSGAGTAEVWLKTTASGTFALTITTMLPAVVEISVGGYSPVTLVEVTV